MDKIEKELLRLGIPAGNLGFEALTGAVRLWMSGVREMTGDQGIYARAVPGRAVNCTERNIRSAIEAAFSRNPDLCETMGCPADYGRGKLTNRDFIATVALRLK